MIRLDGPKTDDDGFADPPAWITSADLAAWITNAAQGVAYTAPPPVEGDPSRLLRFGRQLDVRPVTNGRGLYGELSAEQVAGYLAKYATKSAGDVPIETAHAKTIQRHCGDYHRAALDRIVTGHGPPHKDDPDLYVKFGNWVRELGFRGHFTTKSRRYSVTLGRLRRARRRLAADAARDGRPLDVADLETRLLAEDTEETTLVVASWTYAGTGWPCPGELALAAAARARVYAQWKAEQRKHQQAGRKGKAHE